MKKILFSLLALLPSFFSYAQYGDCFNSADACTNPSFSVTPSGFGTVEEFTSGSNISNPQTNPNASPGNAGCLLSGELNSTWLLINVSSSGTLEFSMGTGGTFNCFDWIMWPYNSTACADIAANALPPVSCNWNGACGGITGMANAGNLPPGADPSDFENGLNVNAGDQFIVCFSNFSSASTNVPLDFFGTAGVTCGSVTNPIICYGETAVIAALDGVSYTWTTTTPGFIGTNATGDTAYVNPTVTTDYFVDIVMPNGSVQSETATVTVLDQLIISSTDVDETCIGDADGSITVSVQNGSTPYTYNLTGASTASNNTGNFTNLPSGNYSIEVIDNNGCTETYTTSLSPGPPCCSMQLSILGTNPLCFSDCDGIAVLDTTGTTGVAPIQWFDSNNAPIAGANTLTLNNLCAGEYYVEVADPLCTLRDTVLITEPTELMLSETSSNLSCFQNSSGEINITASGGSSPYLFSIDNGNTLSSNSIYSNLSADTYSLYIEDDNGCSKTGSVTLTEPDELIFDTILNHNTCNSYNAPCDASAEVIPSGGTSPYAYVWNNGVNSSINNSLCAGLYSVTVTDANGCDILVNNIEISQPDSVVIYELVITPPQCNNTCDAAIEVVNNNGIDFSIDNGVTTQISNIFSNLCFGPVDVTIADANGCSTQSSANVINPSAVLADFIYGPQPATIFNPDITFSDSSTNNTSHYWYFVIGGDTIDNFDASPTVTFPSDAPGIYPSCVVAYDQNLCVDTTCHDIIIEDEYFIFVPNTFSPNNDGQNDIFFPVVNNYNVDAFNFMIFNRWGELIFQSESPNDGWNGNFKGSKAPMGTYIWKIECETAVTRETKVYTGHVNLIR